MAKVRGRAFWMKLAREVEAGGTQLGVARRHGVSQSWLGRWCRQLRDEGSQGVELLPVRVVESRAARRVEVRVGGALVAFDEGTDPGYVAALVRGLSA